MSEIYKIGFGGGCHWCTEAIFQLLKGVYKVEQGYIKSDGYNDYYSEAVIVYYDPKIILLQDLISIHLHTHKSTINHSFRKKYRSAIYYFLVSEKESIGAILKKLQQDFKTPLITQVLAFKEFRSSRKELLNYYISGPEKPFCKLYIHPKIIMLKEKYNTWVK